MDLHHTQTHTHTHTGTDTDTDTQTYRHTNIHTVGTGRKEGNKTTVEDETGGESKDKRRPERKDLSKQQGPIVSLVVAGVTQLTIPAQAKPPTFEHCSKCRIRCIQISVIALTYNYLVWYHFISENL